MEEADPRGVVSTHIIATTCHLLPSLFLSYMGAIIQGSEAPIG